MVTADDMAASLHDSARAWAFDRLGPRADGTTRLLVAIDGAAETLFYASDLDRELLQGEPQRVMSNAALLLLAGVPVVSVNARDLAIEFAEMLASADGEDVLRHVATAAVLQAMDGASAAENNELAVLAFVHDGDAQVLVGVADDQFRPLSLH